MLIARSKLNLQFVKEISDILTLLFEQILWEKLIVATTVYHNVHTASLINTQTLMLETNIDTNECNLTFQTADASRGKRHRNLNLGTKLVLRPLN